MVVPSKQSVVLRNKVLAKRREINALAKQNRAHTIRIFGSVAHGTATNDSDIDILISKSDGMTYFDMAGLSLALENLLGQKIDLVLDDALLDRISRTIRDEDLIYI